MTLPFDIESATVDDLARRRAPTRITPPLSGVSELVTAGARYHARASGVLPNTADESRLPIDEQDLTVQREGLAARCLGVGAPQIGAAINEAPTGCGAEGARLVSPGPVSGR